MYNNIYILVFYLVFSYSFDFELRSVIKLQNKPEIFSTDNFENIYVYENKVLKKYNVSGHLLSSFSGSISSELSRIDVSDPFNILLYYENSNSIVFLDNNLAIIGDKLRLDDIELYSIKAVCKSKQFGIWVFDDFENKLIQYGLDSKKIIQQIDLNKIIIDDLILYEQGNYVFFQISDSDLLIYNDNGLLVEELSFTGKSIFQIKGENILYHDDKYIFSYNFDQKQTDSLILSGINQFDDLRIENDFLYTLRSDSIIVYEKSK